VHLGRPMMTGCTPLKVLVAMLLSATSLVVISSRASAAAIPPDSPTQPSATVVSGGVNVSWTASASAGTDSSGINPATIAQYNVYVGTSSGGENTATPACSSTSTTCEVTTGLTAGTTYFFYVQAVNSASISSLPSTEGQFTTAATVSTPNMTIGSTPSSPTYSPSVPITLTATLDIPAPGTVAFSVNSSPASGCNLSAVDTSAAPYTATCSYQENSAGSLSVTADFTPTDPTTFNSASAGPTPVVVSKANQAPLSITSTSGTLANPLLLTTSGGSGSGAVTYSVTDGTAQGCVISPPSGGFTLGATSPGTCLVTATEAADSNYLPVVSPPTPVTLIGTQAPLTITSLSGTFGSTITLTTSGGSGTGAVSYVATNGSAAGCSVSGATLSATSVGTCVVTATRAADAKYAARSSTPTSVAFSGAGQSSLILTSLNGTFGSTVTLTTSGGSGTGAVSYAATNGSAAGCSVSGSTLSATNAGTCLVTATKAGDATHVATSSPPTTVTFAPATQSPLSLTSLSGPFGSTITLTTSGGSGTGAVSYVATNGSAAGCSVGGATLSATSAGTCVVTATKAGDGNYQVTSSPPTAVTFTSGVRPVLSVTTLSGTYGSTITLAISGASGTGAVTYSATNGTAAGCSVSANVLRATSAGTCVVTATKAADAKNATAQSAPTIVTFARALQAPLRVSSLKGTFRALGPLTTSGGSGSGAVSFVVVAAMTAHCQVKGASLSASSTGVCEIRATKAADRNHLSVTSSPAIFTVNRGRQAALHVNPTYGSINSTILLSTHGGSGTGQLRFVVVGGTASGCKVAQTILSATSAGTCLVRATKAMDHNFLATTSSTVAIAISKLAQGPLVLTSTHGLYGASSPLAARGGRGTGAVTFTVRDLTASGCAISGSPGHYSLVSTSAGTCLVTVVKAADSDYPGTHSPETVFVVARAPQRALSVTSVQGSLGRSLPVTVSGGSGTGGVSLHVQNGTATACALRGATVSSTTAGTCLVTAVKGGDRNYLSASAPVATLTFSALTQAPFFIEPAAGKVGVAVSLVARGGTGTGAVLFTLAGGTSTTCSINGATLLSRSAGTCLVRALKKGDATHQAATSPIVTVVFTKKLLTRSLVVSATTNLHAGEQVRIGGSGFTPNEHLFIAECVLGATKSSMCAAAKSVVVGPTGVLPTTVVTMVTGGVGSSGCGSTAANLNNCELRVFDAASRDVEVVSLHFAPPPGRTFVVTPSTNLKNGEIITLSGTGFTPNDRVSYAECLVGTITEARCNLSTFKSVVIGPTGVFPTTRLKVVAGKVGPGTCGTSASDLSACDISVANGFLSDAAVVHLTFAAPK
jgi:trimeric autotransporter adhesin